MQFAPFNRSPLLWPFEYAGRMAEGWGAFLRALAADGGNPSSAAPQRADDDRRSPGTQVAVRSTEVAVPAAQVAVPATQAGVPSTQVGRPPQALPPIPWMGGFFPPFGLTSESLELLDAAYRRSFAFQFEVQIFGTVRIRPLDDGPAAEEVILPTRAAGAQDVRSEDSHSGPMLEGGPFGSLWRAFRTPAVAAALAGPRRKLLTHTKKLVQGSIALLGR